VVHTTTAFALDGGVAPPTGVMLPFTAVE